MNKTKIIGIAVFVAVLVLAITVFGGLKPSQRTEKPYEETLNSTEHNGKDLANETLSMQTEETKNNEPVTEEVDVVNENTATNPDGNMSEEFIEDNISIGVIEGVREDPIEEDDDVVVVQQEIIAPEKSGNTDDELDLEIHEITYDIYNALSASQQQAVIDQFGSAEDFMKWYNYIKAKYEAEHPNIEVGPGGVVDLG